MDSPVFDSIMVEKQRAVVRFNRFRFLGKLWKIVEVFMVLGLISWSSPRIPDALKSAAGAFCSFDYVFDHLVVFLLGNAIIVAVVFLYRLEGAGEVTGVADSYYDEYSKYRAQRESRKTEVIEEEKQIVVFESPDVEKDVLEIEEVDTMIPLAAKVEKFRRTESEKTEEIEEEKQIMYCESPEMEKDLPELQEVDRIIRLAVKKMEKIRRTESGNLSSAAYVRRSKTEERVHKRFNSAEMRRLNSEEFRQLVDEFLEERRPYIG